MIILKNRKIPLRTCVVTRERLEKKNLIRIVKNKDGEVFVDESLKANGRGAYIKKDINVLEKAKKTKILEKNLETEIDEKIYNLLEDIIKR